MKTWICLASATALAAQPKSLCEIIEVLTAYDGEVISLRGEILFDDARGVLAIGATCEEDERLTVKNHGWPTVVLLEADGTAATDGLANLRTQLQNARQQGRLVRATVTANGRLSTIHSGPASSGFGPGRFAPAQIRVSALTGVDITPLPKPEELPVLSMCELFDNLRAYRGKRIAVRGYVSGGMEGAWIFDAPCKGSGFVTNGYRWPASLSLGGMGASIPEPPRIRDLKVRLRPRGAYETLVGVLRLTDHYSVTCDRGVLRGIGMGHMGGAAGELLIETSLNPKPGPAPAGESSAQTCTGPLRLSDEECARITDITTAGFSNCTATVTKLAAAFFDQLTAAVRARRTDEVEQLLRQMQHFGLQEDYLPLAIRYGDVKMVRLFLARGPSSVAKPGPLGLPVHVAAMYQRWDIFRALIRAGADPNALDADGRTPLVAYGLADAESVQQLSAAGIDVNAAIHGSPTLLVKAITRGASPGVIRALLEAHANVNAPAEKMNSPLHHAVRARRADVIPLLLQFGASRDYRNVDGLTARDLAGQLNAFMEGMSLR